MESGYDEPVKDSVLKTHKTGVIITPARQLEAIAR
jgi:hypothetical protein